MDDIGGHQAPLVGKYFSPFIVLYCFIVVFSPQDISNLDARSAFMRSVIQSGTDCRVAETEKIDFSAGT
jgi:hypothetical protein